MASDPREIIATRSMTAFQIVAVAITIGLNALDGFDVLAINFASPGITREWGIDKAALGLVKSTGLFGMAAGSLFIAPVADRIGRRPTILGCLLMMTLGMLLAATAGDVWSLSLWRVLTGLGIGGMLGSINAMAAEYSNARRRDLSVGLMTIGYPVGAVLGGMVAAMLLARYDWRSVFVFGGLVSAAFIPLVWWRLPESIEWLLHKRPADALGRVNAILARMGHPTVTELPLATPAEAKAGLADIFRAGLIRNTAAITIAYFFHIMTFYYILNWIPDIVTDLGYTPVEGAQALVWANVGGATGGALLGWLTLKFGLKPLTIAAMLATAFFVTAFGQVADDLSSLMIVATIAGFFSNAVVVGLYAIMARAFPTHARATGTGFVIGTGRFGGWLAPVIPGFLFAANIGRDQVSIVMAIGSLVAAVALIWLRLARPSTR